MGASDPGLAGPDAAVRSALSEPLPGEERDADLVDLPSLAERTGLSLPLLEAVVREGLLLPRATDPDRFAVVDAEVVHAALRIVDAGVPLAELLELGRRTDTVMRDIAERAVDLFARYVRDPAVGTAGSDEAATAQMLAALGAMLPATERMIARHFRMLLLAAARERLGEGDR